MSLQVGHDERFQRREWRVERVAWAVGALVILAALLGLLGGPGVLSSATAQSDAGNVLVTYRRFIHMQADSQLSVTIRSAAVQAGEVPMRISTSWLSEVDVLGISPEPVEQRAAGDAVTMLFAASPGAELTVSFSFRGISLWRHDVSIRVGSEIVRFSQFVYP